MTQIERELAEHLLHLSVTIGPRPLGSPASESAGHYVRSALDNWGFAVEWSQPSHPAAGWHIIGLMGSGLPGRVQLRARLDNQSQTRGDPGAASVAVLLALGRLLAQHQLRHSLEVVVYSSADSHVAPGTTHPTPGSPGAGLLVAAVSFDGPGQAFVPNRVSANGVSPELAAGVRRLLARYPEVIWTDPLSQAAGADLKLSSAPGLCVSGASLAIGAPPGLPAHSSQRLREAAMLGAEIVALLQSQSPASFREQYAC